MKHKNWFWGIFFLAAAVFVIASQVGAFVNIGFWSIAATVALAAVFIGSIADMNFFGVLISAVLLYEIYQKPLDLYFIPFWQLLLSAIFASIGLGLIFRNRRRWKKWFRANRYGKSVESLDGNDLYTKASFTEACRYLRSDNLKRAELVVSFGELKVYFDQVQLNPDGAEVIVDVNMAEMKLYIPKNWCVIDNVKTSLGSIKNDAHFVTEEGAPTLTLVGRVSLGNLDVHFV